MIKKVWGFSEVRFVLVGVINTLVDFSVLNILVFIFGLNNIFANIISVSIAMLVSYFLNYTIVFRYQGKNYVKSITLFLAITAFGLFVLQNIVIYLFIHIINLPAELATSIIHGIGFENFSEEFIALNLAKSVATGVTMVWNYLMYKNFVFKDRVLPTKKTSEN